MKIWRSGGIAPRILNLGNRWRWVVSFTLRPLYPRGKSSGAHWRGGWFGHRTGLDSGANKKSLCPCRKLNPGRSARDLVTILTKLFRLLHFVMMIFKSTHRASASLIIALNKQGYTCAWLIFPSPLRSFREGIW